MIEFERGMLFTAVFICLSAGLYFFVKFIIEKISEFIYRKRLNRTYLDKLPEIYSSYNNLQIQNYILQKNEDKYLKEISCLKNRIKKLKELQKANSVNQNEK